MNIAAFKTYVLMIGWILIAVPAVLLIATFTHRAFQTPRYRAHIAVSWWKVVVAVGIMVVGGGVVFLLTGVS